MRINGEVDVHELRVMLREATAPVHRKLDAHPVLKPLFDAKLNPAQYSLVLRCFHDFYSQIQPILGRELSHIPVHYELTNRLPWLNQDLADLRQLGCGSAQATTFSLPALNSSSAVIGALYVIEGSTLGAQVIAQQVRRSLGFHATWCARFFHGFGEVTLEHWRKYWDFATTLCEPAHYPHATDAAVALFECLIAGLDEAWAQRETTLLHPI